MLRRNNAVLGVLVCCLLTIALGAPPATASVIGGPPIPVPERPTAGAGSIESDGGGEQPTRQDGTAKPSAHKAVRLTKRLQATPAFRPKIVRHPTQMKLTLASSKKLDVRTLHGRVVKTERPETEVPYGNEQSDADAESDAPSGDGDQPPGDADGGDGNSNTTDGGTAQPSGDPDAGGQVDSGSAAAVAAVPPAIDPTAIERNAAPHAAAPAPSDSFDGLDFATWGAGHPPDENGDVGPTYYIETVNTAIGIFRKSDHAQVAAFTFNALMSQGHFGNFCDTDNFGDPVVLYDSFEDRWIITDFAFQLDSSHNVNPQHVFECIAASKSGDPVTGGWNFYSVETQGGLGDYPKLGVWRDGIYMSVNLFGYTAGASFISPRVYAIDKAQMYAGAPSVLQLSFDGPSSDFTLIPGNARLQTGTPPSGTPEYFVSTWQFLNAITVYKFQVDWNATSASTFSGPFTSLTATAWPNASVANAPSQGGNNLDVLQIRAMAQAQYSNIGGTESLWLDHTVRRANTTGFAAPRWYQVDVTGTTVANGATQAATYDPDGANVLHRFMPSLAIDHVGDLAMGYTTSSSTTLPAVVYAGRLAGDPLNTFTQSERTLIQGTGTQTGNCGSSACIRWGDYSGMALDPTDGCTFWMVGEYYATNGLNDQTRIGAFRYPSCTSISNGHVQGTVSNGNGDPIEGATVALGSRSTTTDSAGHYSFSVPAGTYPTLSAAADGYGSDSRTDVPIPDGGSATRDFTLSGFAQTGCFTDTTKADFQAGIASSDCDVTSSPGDVTLSNTPVIDQQNTAGTSTGTGFGTSNWTGQTFTAALNGPLTKVDVQLFCSGCGATPPNLTLSVRATSGGLPTGADLASATIAGSTFASGSTATATATFGSPVTISAGTQYALILRPVSAPAGSGYFWIRSSPSTYPNGQRVLSANSGATWNADSTRDYNFKAYVSAGFAPSATFTSSLKDANPDPARTANWTTLSFSADTPAGTDVKFQVAASNDQNGATSFVGPDGTASTYFTTSGADESQFDGFRYLRYKAYLSTTDPSVTPTLHDVTVCYEDVLATSTTTLGSDANPSVFSQQVTFTATVSGNVGTPTGAVQFNVDGSDVGTPVPLDGSGQATYQTSSLAVTVHGVVATYSGDSAYDPSSDTLRQTVGPAGTTTVITADHNPSVFNQQVTFTATVTAASPGSGTPAGTVQFNIDGSDVGSPVALDANGKATYQVSDLSVGGHTVTATYAGNSSFNGSNDHLTQTVDQADTTTALTSSVNPSALNHTVTFTATVSVSSPGGGTAGGSVQFNIDGSDVGSPVTLVSGVATFSTSTLSAGDHTVTATYAGNASFNGSNDHLTQTVGKADTTTVLTSNVNPSVFHQSVTFKATVDAVNVSAGTPAGTVQFNIDGSDVGSPVALDANGKATYQVSDLSVGGHTVTATYAGNSSFNGSNDHLTQTVDQADTTTALTSSVNPSALNHTVTFTATVSVSSPGGGTAGGSVQFNIDGSDVGSPVTLVSGVATFSTSTLSAGDHTVTATYAGNASFNGSNDHLTQTVGKADTTTVLTSNVNPSVFHQSVTFKATVDAVNVSAGTPAGTVQFNIDGSDVGSPVALDANGKATYQVSDLSVGGHTVTATYAGNSSFNGSNDHLTQTVDQADTTTALTSSVNPSALNHTVTFTATVSVSSPGGGTAGGSVQFNIDGSDVGSPVTLVSGVATFSTSTLSAGDHTVTATYAGNASFNGSNDHLTQTVGKADTTTVLTSNVNPSVFHQSVTFKATVDAVNVSAGTPAGTVQFNIDGSDVGSPVALDANGKATYQVSDLSVGGHTVTATYAGNSSFNGSNDHLTQTVDQADTTTALTSSVNPSDYGQSVTLTVTVGATSPSSGVPAGTVDFTDTTSNTSLCSGVSLDGSGQATCTTSNLGVGAHRIRAGYTATSSYTASGDAIRQLVRKVATTVTLHTVPEPSVHGQGVRLVAQVSFTAPAPGTPTGTLTFRRAGTVLCANVAIDATGRGACGPLTGLPTGADRLRVTYSGDAQFRPSISRVRIHDVKPAATSTRVKAVHDPVSNGAIVKLSATVTTQAPGNGVPQGSVQFLIDGRLVAPQVALVNGHAHLSIRISLKPGSHALRAFYVGDPDFVASSSATWPLIVQ